jgi:hypothetical protein
MKHIAEPGLDLLEALLEDLRAIPELREKKRGVFYRRSKAFLHFHEDPKGLFADVRLATDFERHRVSTQVERRRLLAKIRGAL